jgi:hypothetical protein
MNLHLSRRQALGGVGAGFALISLRPHLLRAALTEKSGASSGGFYPNGMNGALKTT